MANTLWLLDFGNKFAAEWERAALSLLSHPCGPYFSVYDLSTLNCGLSRSLCTRHTYTHVKLALIVRLSRCFCACAQIVYMCSCAYMCRWAGGSQNTTQLAHARSHTHTHSHTWVNERIDGGQRYKTICTICTAMRESMTQQHNDYTAEDVICVCVCVRSGVDSI